MVDMMGFGIVLPLLPFYAEELGRLAALGHPDHRLVLHHATRVGADMGQVLRPRGTPPPPPHRAAGVGALVPPVRARGQPVAPPHIAGNGGRRRRDARDRAGIRRGLHGGRGTGPGPRLHRGRVRSRDHARTGDRRVLQPLRARGARLRGRRAVPAEPDGGDGPAARVAALPLGPGRRVEGRGRDRRHVAGLAGAVSAVAAPRGVFPDARLLHLDDVGPRASTPNACSR